MTHDPASIDISTMPDLARLVDEVQRTQRPCRLRRGTVDVAMIVPAPPAIETTVRQEKRPMSIEQLKQHLATPPTGAELARRQAVVASTREHRKEFVIIPLTTADLVHQARQEESESYASDR